MSGRNTSFVFAVLLVQGMRNRGCISVFFNSHGTRMLAYLGKLSMYMYLFHFGILNLWQTYLPGFNNIAGYIIFFAVVFLVSIIVMSIKDYLTKTTRFQNKA